MFNYSQDHSYSTTLVKILQDRLASGSQFTRIGGKGLIVCSMHANLDQITQQSSHLIQESKKRSKKLRQLNALVNEDSPHIFDIAASAYLYMLNHGRHASIILR